MIGFPSVDTNVFRVSELSLFWECGGSLFTSVVYPLYASSRKSMQRSCERVESESLDEFLKKKHNYDSFVTF
eukprot:TRINITY_DN2641_c0_g1_i3.p3 TRINITY_DN2641_c0_g1~~TRINITY_DN2641_c0_g1_i3.p3  ORF type:complete len:72 (-),score=9.17 TRINITY_DN2641_c0_g1_i3:653-868(-)